MFADYDDVVPLVVAVEMATVSGVKDMHKISNYPENSFFILLTEYVSLD